VEQVYQKLKEQEDPDGAGGGNGAGQSNPGNCSDSPGDKSEKEEDQSEWEMKTFQAAQMALQQGDAPNSIKRIVQDIQNPKVPWRDQLRHFFSVKVREDYSWRKGNTRFIHSGLYLPCLDGEKMGKIVVGVDTSGSISDQILSAFQSELQDVLDTCRPESMEVLYCDAAIAHTETYQPGDIIKLECHGGGGTDFRPVFAHVEQEGWQPVALIYFTDLYGAHRDEEPQYPVLWACFSKESKVPYGDVIHVDI
jgi:predicted metal-dependent peptidase